MNKTWGFRGSGVQRDHDMNFQIIKKVGISDIRRLIAWDWELGSSGAYKLAYN